MGDGKLGLVELQGTRTFISGHSVSLCVFLKKLFFPLFIFDVRN